jgi:hypothetical protein
VALAAIAPHLKEAALRLATYFAAAAARLPHQTLSISTRELSRHTRLAPSALNRAIQQLSDQKLAYIRVDPGTTTHRSSYVILFLRTVRGASFGEAPPKEAPPQTALLFEQHPASFGEAPPTENTALTADAAALQISGASLRLINQIHCATAKDFNPEQISEFRSWLHGYMERFGRDQNDRPIPKPHPPTNTEVAQFLAIAEPRRLADLLNSLLKQNQTCRTYYWFVVVALQRLHGIHITEQKAARAALRDVKRQPPSDGRQFAEQLTLEAVAGVKKLR